jgi:phosphoribosylglycinamide formyltransferase-1
MKVKAQKSRIVVLISGNGSNLQAIIDASLKNDSSNYTIVAVISNKPDAYGLTRAEKQGIPTHVVNHELYTERENFEQALSLIIEPYQPDIIVLAGFMRILTASFVEPYIGRMLNTHPSILPKYPGLNTHKRALESGDKWHGVSIHFVTPTLDGGPIIAAGKFKIESSDNEDSLAEKVKKIEHQLYPQIIESISKNNIALTKSQNILWQGLEMKDAIQFTF